MKVPNGFRGEERLLVAVWPEQKQSHRIMKKDGTYVDLFLGFKEWRADMNGWETNPTVGRVIVGNDELKAGDFVLTQHNAFENDNKQIHGVKEVPELSDMVHEGEKVFAIEKSLLWLGITQEGEPYPIGDSLICKRIYEKELKSDSGLVIVQDQRQYPTMLYLDKKPNHITEIEPGQIIVVSTKSDCELKYVWENKHTSVIRVRYDSFMGAIVEGLEYEFEKESQLHSS